MIRPTALPRAFRRTVVAALAGSLLLTVVPSPAHADHEFNHLEPIGIDGFCAAVPEGSSPFTDIGSSTFRHDAECLFVPQITRGGADGTVYRPLGPVPRSQMASFIVRMMGVAKGLELPGRELAEVEPAGGEGPFRDVSPMDVHASNINALAAEEIVFGGVGGTATDLYHPTRVVTRAQMATFVRRAVSHLLQEQVGADVDLFFDIDDNVHAPGINYVGDRRIAVGNGYGRFDPDQPVTRGQMAAFLARTLAVLVEGGYIAPLPAER